MPNTSSAKKALRNSRRKELLNKSKKHNIRQALKDLRKTLATDAKNYQDKLSKVFSTLDKAVKTNVIPKGRADRKKARTVAMVNKELGLEKPSVDAPAKPKATKKVAKKTTTKKTDTKTTTKAKTSTRTTTKKSAESATKKTTAKKPATKATKKPAAKKTTKKSEAK